MFYFSLAELGPVILSNTAAWLTVCCERSSQVSELSAGPSQLMAKILETFFCNPYCDLVDGGMAIKVGDKHIRLHLQLGGFLQDGQAFKLVFCLKADAGCRFCVLCKNMFLRYSKQAAADEDDSDAEHEAEDGLVCGACKHSELALASNSEILASVDRLARRAATGTKAELKLWEQASGFNHEPHGLLLNRRLRDKGVVAPASQYVHDWFHALVSSGCLQTCLHLLLAALSAAGLPIYATLREYLAGWRMPGAVANAHLAELFTAKKAESNKQLLLSFAFYVSCRVFIVFSLFSSEPLHESMQGKPRPSNALAQTCWL